MTRRGRTGLGETSAPWIYTTRLQKGGALIEDMRQLVRLWGDTSTDAVRENSVRSNILNKGTRVRLQDVYRRTFLPRFVDGPIPNAWKLARPLEDANAPVQVVRPVYYWISGRGEPLMADFCREFIFPRQAIVRAGISTDEVVGWPEEMSWG